MNSTVDTDIKNWTIWFDAYSSALEAGNDALVEPMIITDGSRTWKVDSGVCGFAWVEMPGNTSFARWAKKAKIGYISYLGGLHIRCTDFNQSMQRKQAFCHMLVKKLQAAGIRCSAFSRMD